MTEIPNDHLYGVYLQEVIEELEKEIFQLQHQLKQMKQIPIDDAFLEKVCRSNLPLWDKFAPYQKKREFKDLTWWIMTINKHL